jgi:putative protein-disulfide isomerase
MNLIYCYDAYCGWCYGFSPVMKQIVEKYKDRLQFEVISGGMILPEQPTSISVMAPFIQQAYKTVEEHTGITFGEDFLWHIFNHEQSDWFPSSEKPAIALAIFKEAFPTQAVEIASDIQYALNFEGRDLTDDEAYRHLLEKYPIEPDVFFQKLHEPKYKELAYHDFATVQQLQIKGFPAVLLQLTSGKFYLLANGYTPFEVLDERIQHVLQELQN